ncbi:MAG: alpha/beta hydrolase [Acidimicrobiia bacterium]|nr:alpha/beta hydrolase [Acidimicrobiia bacterium]
MTRFPAATSITVGRSNADPITLSTHQMGTGPAVVFCHGFPDLAFGWRHQLGPVADAGFRAIAPDQRGYGASAAPDLIAEYGLTELTGDLVGLLDALGIDRAFFVGHDWGGFVAWAMPVLHPERVLGVTGLCTPYLAFPSVATHLGIVEGTVDRQYVAWFQEPGVAEAEMDATVEPILARIFRTGVPLRTALEFALADGTLNMNPFKNPESWPMLGRPLGSPADLAHYCAVFGRTGFRGGINWYRNADRNAAEHPAIGRQSLDIPGLMLTAEWDPGLRPEFADRMVDTVADLTRHDLLGVGHWIQQEVPDQVNRHLIDWLRAKTS